MKTDVFITTYPPHFNYLNRIVDMYLNSTVKPDNIVISVSSYNENQKNFFDDLENKNKIVKILRNKNLLLTAESRSLAKNSDADIIIYHDSDDYPHNSRVEMIKYFFQNYDIMHLHHSYHKCNGNLTHGKNWDPKKESWGSSHKFENLHNTFNLEDINIYTTDQIYKKYFPDGKIETGQQIQKQIGYAFTVFKQAMHMGANAIRREVLEEIPYSSKNFLFNINNSRGRGQDYEYYMKMIYKYNKGLLISYPLYYYNTPSYI